MDLTNFTSKKEEEKEELVLNNNDVKISKKGNKIYFNIKTTDAIEKYQNFMFFAPTHATIINNEKEAEEFFELSKKEKVEGLMIKNLSAPYKPGLRAKAMAKLKETKEDIDVIILKAEHGTGKRAGFYSSFTVGVLDNSNDNEEAFLEIGKVSSGIKEIGEEGASLEKINSLIKPLILSEEKGEAIIKPKIVLQIRYQEIQKSTIYNSGYALRFPRIIELREDKPIYEANTIEDIERFSKMQ